MKEKKKEKTYRIIYFLHFKNLLNKKKESFSLLKCNKYWWLCNGNGMAAFGLSKSGTMILDVIIYFYWCIDMPWLKEFLPQKFLKSQLHWYWSARCNTASALSNHAGIDITMLALMLFKKQRDTLCSVKIKWLYAFNGVIYFVVFIAQEKQINCLRRQPRIGCLMKESDKGFTSQTNSGCYF